MFGMLNELSNRVALAVGKGKSAIILPPLDWKGAADAEVAFDTIIGFLASSTFIGNTDAELLRVQLSDAASARAGMHSPLYMASVLIGFVEFPIYALPERIEQIVTNDLRSAKGPRHVYLPKIANANSVTEEFRGIMQSQLSALDGMIRYTAPSAPPSPSDVSMAAGAKKRSIEEMEWEDDDDL